MTAFQKAFQHDHLALLDKPPWLELAQHIYVLALDHLKTSTSSSTVTKMLTKSEVRVHASPLVHLYAAWTDLVQVGNATSVGLHACGNAIIQLCQQ